MKKYILTFFILCAGLFSEAQVTSVASSQNPTCIPGCDGQIILATAGGFPPFTYSIFPVGPIQSTPGAFTSLCGGTVYTITTTDAINITNTFTVVLAYPPAISIITSNVNDATCNLCNGSATINATGGVPPYIYNITPMSTIIGNNITNMCSGIYTITVVDANACSQNSTVLINNNIPNLILSGDTIECGIQKPIIANFTNGVAPISYNLQPGNVTNSTGIFNIAASNTYTITATDASICSTSLSFTSNPVLLSNALTGVTATSISYDESCYLAGDGGIDVNAIPSAGLTYLWNTNATTQDILNAPSGDYSVKISNANSDCLFLYDTINVLGANCGSINGTVYHDSASNCIYDAGDYNLANIQIQLSTGDTTFTNLSGYYEFNQVPYGTHTVSQNSIVSTNSCTQANSVTLNNATPISSNNDFKDSLDINLDESIYINTSPFIAALGNGNYGMTLYNNKNFSIQSTIKVVLDTILTYNFSATPPTTIIPNNNGDTLIWNLNVNPGFTSINFNCTYLNSIIVATQLTTCASIYPDVFVDDNLINNTACWTNQLLNSYDPNDKTVSPIGEGINGNITVQDSVLDYVVRFQNTGNAPAINVEIIDTLSDKLDLSSFEMLSASHNYTIDIKNGNTIHFKFKNIYLADSTTNEPASHGNIHYRIKQKNSNQLGDVITNSASIYFDFNPPIKTNTTLNTLWQPLSVKQFKTSNLGIYPNPMKNNCIITLPTFEQNAVLVIYNSLGQKILSKNFEGSQVEFKNKSYPKGQYFIQINTEAGKMYAGKVMIE